MSFGARCGFFVLLAGLALPALAQERPAGAWKDPPAQESTGADGPKDTGGDSAKAADRAKPEASTTEARAPEAASRPKVQRGARTERKRATRTREATGKAMSRREVRPGSLPARISRRPRATAVARLGPDDDAFGPPQYPLTQFRREGWGSLVSRRRARSLARAEAREQSGLHGALFGDRGSRHSFMSGPDGEDDGLPE